MAERSWINPKTGEDMYWDGETLYRGANASAASTNTTKSATKTETEEAAVPALTEEQKKELEELKKAQRDLTKNAISNPEGVVSKADVSKINPQANQLIDPSTGQVKGNSPSYNAATVQGAHTANAPQEQDAVTYEAQKVTDKVKEELDQLEAAQGELPPEATVQGQMAKLMQQFEGGEVPPWAAGAIRSANAKMAARGLGASSMAGAAITQAAMESALPIASQDASINANLVFKNLDNRQQTALFKSQQTIASLFTDQAAENVERQINAASKNQVTQFYANLHTQVEQFNAAQVNAIKQFNAGEQNTAKRFNAEMKNLREQFNAQNSLVIAQANAKWRQDLATINTAAENDANMEAAQAANALTSQALDAIWQRERDLMSFAFQSSENEMDRQLELFLAEKELDAYKDEADAQRDADNKRGLGQLVGSVVGTFF